MTTTIETELARFDKSREATRSRLEAMGDDFAAAVRAVESYNAPRDYSFTDISVSVDMDWYDAVNVSINIHALNEWSDMQPLVDALESEGFEIYNQNDAPGSNMRIMYGARNGQRGVLIFAAFLRGEDATCKVIETGETTPVLKFVCPGDADYPMEASV